MSSLMWCTLNLWHPKMNVKSWVNESGTEKERDNIFTQTYLYSTYDRKWYCQKDCKKITA